MLSLIVKVITFVRTHPGFADAINELIALAEAEIQQAAQTPTQTQ